MASSREVVTEDKKRLKNEKDELETKFDKSIAYTQVLMVITGIRN